MRNKNHEEAAQGSEQSDSIALSAPPAKQLWLLQLQNPLISRFGKEFFSSIPKAPGVYLMRDDRNELIYVGKSKSLRDRLRSYTHVNAENSSRKVLTLVHKIKSIEWEILPDETSALLRENLLLRTLRPTFNVVNTSPHTYLFAHLRLEESGIRFHLGMTQDSSYPDIYGAFKGVSVSFRAQKALFRLVWASYHECRNGFEFPSILTNRRKVDHYLFKFPSTVCLTLRIQLYRDLKRFYNGTSNRLLVFLIERLLAREDLGRFVRALLQQDIEVALDFYRRCANRNRTIRLKLKLKDKVLPQDQLDDLLVLLNDQMSKRK